MLRRTACATLVPATVAVAAALLPTSAATADPPTALLGDGSTAIPLVGKAMISVSDYGYRFQAGRQGSRLTVTQVDGKLLWTDTGTTSWRSLPSTCTKRSVTTGVSALCSIPARWSGGKSMFIEVWPRLGHDSVDTSSLPARYRSWVLADAGRDKVRTGAGDDFVNGAQDGDQVWGGGGDDWLRTGPGSDVLWGEGGNDRLVGVEADDSLHGGPGDDRVEGGPGNDRLWADAGRDTVSCGDGRDTAYADASDRLVQCEARRAY